MDVAEQQVAAAINAGKQRFIAEQVLTRRCACAHAGHLLLPFALHDLGGKPFFRAQACTRRGLGGHCGWRLPQFLPRWLTWALQAKTCTAANVKQVGWFLRCVYHVNRPAQSAQVTAS